jgi:putative adhesin
MKSLQAVGLAVGLVLVVASAQAADTKEVHRTVPLDTDGRVTVETFKGTVDVKTWDRPEIQIDAVIEPDPDGREQAEKVRLTEVRVSGSGAAVAIRSDYHAAEHLHFLGFLGGDDGTLPFVRYTVQMPSTAKLEIEDHKSQIRVAGLRSDLKLHTYKGTARVVGLDGAARVDTYKGDVRVEFARYGHDSRFETYKGEVEVRLPRDSRFELEGQAGRRGDIETDFAMTTHAGRSRSAEITGAVNGGGPRLRMTTYKGSLRVRAS